MKHRTIEGNRAHDSKAAMRRKIIIVSAVIGGLAALAAFLLDAQTLFCGDEEPCWPWEEHPIVAMRVVDVEGGGECLEFAFSHLPRTFSIRTISLDIVDALGPSPIGGDQAASPLVRRVNRVLGPSVFRAGPEPIELEEPFVAERNSDAAIVEFCPILRTPGFTGRLWLDPSFVALDSTPAEIELRFEGDAMPEHGIELALSHPTGVVLETTDAFQGLIEE